MTALPMLDPLFHWPLLTGLVLALTLPALGAMLLLRDEWLAALGLSHLAAAGSLLAIALGLPGLLGGLAIALVGGATKTILKGQGNLIYAVMLLLGWSGLLLIAANSHAGSAMGQAMIEGQLYFAGTLELASVVVLAIGLAILMPWWGPRLLRAHYFPDDDRANQRPAWRWHLGFDLSVASAIAVSVYSLGVMASFALLLMPAWIAFQIAPNWRWTLILSTLLGVSGYLIGFALSLSLDQPFGPIQVLVLLAMAAAIRLLVRHYF